MTKKAQLRGRAARLAAMLPSGSGSAARAPFVLLVVLLLGGGLVSLLVLNSALNTGSFQLSELQRRTTELTDERQALQRDVDEHAALDALRERARELGMVPGGAPAFLGPDGKVRGEPAPATGVPVAPSAFHIPAPAAFPLASYALHASTPSGAAPPSASAARTEVAP